MYTSDFKSSLHCASIAAKAFQRCSHLFKGLHTLDTSTPVLSSICILMYVRPILEYNSPVWNPWLLHDIRCVERVQRFFTRTIFKRVKLLTMNSTDSSPTPSWFSFTGVSQSIFRPPYVF